MTSSAPVSPAERRRVQQRQDARRSILDATEALLVEDGYERFSMRRLAARCGYTAPTIYHHFGDKQRLLDAVLEERLALVLAHLRRVRRADDPVETLLARLRAFVRFGIENPTHHRLLSMPRPDTLPPPPSGEEIRELMAGPLEELANQGRLRADDLETASQFFWALLHGLVSLHVTRPDVEWRDDLVDFSFEAALSGLVTPLPARRASS